MSLNFFDWRGKMDELLTYVYDFNNIFFMFYPVNILDLSD